MTWHHPNLSPAQRWIDVFRIQNSTCVGPGYGMRPNCPGRSSTVAVTLICPDMIFRYLWWTSVASVKVCASLSGKDTATKSTGEYSGSTSCSTNSLGTARYLILEIELRLHIQTGSLSKDKNIRTLPQNTVFAAWKERFTRSLQISRTFSWHRRTPDHSTPPRSSRRSKTASHIVLVFLGRAHRTATQTEPSVDDICSRGQNRLWMMSKCCGWCRWARYLVTFVQEIICGSRLPPAARHFSILENRCQCFDKRFLQ